MQLRELNGIRIITLPQRVDVTSATELEELCNSLINNSHCKIVCDFSGTEYVSSIGLRVFLSALKRTVKAGGGLALCCLNPGILEIFDMTGLTSLFPVHDSITDSLAEFGTETAPAAVDQPRTEKSAADVEITIEKKPEDMVQAYLRSARQGSMDEKV